MIDLPQIDHFVAWVVKDTGFPQSIEEVGKLVDRLTSELSLMIVERCFYKFDPVGVTYVAILSQSHLVIHTWPERKLIRVDLVSCEPVSLSSLKMVVNSTFSSQMTRVLKVKD